MHPTRGRNPGVAPGGSHRGWHGVLLGLLLAGCGPGEGAAPLESVTTTKASTAGLVATSSWARSTDPVFLGTGYQLINAVRFGGPGLVAVGVDASGRDADAAIWVAVDGRSWTRLMVPGLTGPGAQGLHDIAVGTTGMVAVGLDESSGVIDPAIWFSTDGREWQRVSAESLAGDGHEEILTVVATPTGFVAGGFEVTGDEADAAVWVSPDGVAWTRVHQPAFADLGTQRIHSLTVTPNGILAGGTHYHPNQFGLYNLDARVWLSADGTSWTRVDAPTLGGPGWQYITAVLATPTGLFAAGGDIVGQPGLHNDAAIWRSEDGITWTQIEDPALGGIGAQHISALALDGAGMIAVGYDTASLGNRLPAVWTSPDGIRWTRTVDAALAEPGHRWMNAIAIGPLGLVAVGGDGTRPVGDPVVWSRTP